MDKQHDMSRRVWLMIYDRIEKSESESMNNDI